MGVTTIAIACLFGGALVLYLVGLVDVLTRAG